MINLEIIIFCLNSFIHKPYKTFNFLSVFFRAKNTILAWAQEKSDKIIVIDRNR